MDSRQRPDATQRPSDFGGLSRQEVLELLKESFKPKSESSPPDLSKNLQVVTAVVSLLGLGLYGAVRFGQQLFYNRLGLTPEEVGLSYAAAVSRAAVVIVALLMTLISIISAIGVGDYLPGKGALSAVIGALFGVAVASAAVFISVITLGAVGWIFGAAICFGGMVAYSILAGLRSRDISVQSLRARPVIPLTIISIITIIGFTLSGMTALLSAERVNQGKELSGAGAYGILGLRSEQVTVTGQLPNGFTAPKDILYLGRSDGMIILFDYSKDEPIRIPSAGVAVLHK